MHLWEECSLLMLPGLCCIDKQIDKQTDWEHFQMPLDTIWWRLHLGTLAPSYPRALSFTHQPAVSFWPCWCCQFHTLKCNDNKGLRNSKQQIKVSGTELNNKNIRPKWLWMLKPQNSASSSGLEREKTRATRKLSRKRWKGHSWCQRHLQKSRGLHISLILHKIVLKKFLFRFSACTSGKNFRHWVYMFGGWPKIPFTFLLTLELHTTAAYHNMLQKIWINKFQLQLQLQLKNAFARVSKNIFAPAALNSSLRWIYTIPEVESATN